MTTANASVGDEGAQIEAFWLWWNGGGADEVAAAARAGDGATVLALLGERGRPINTSLTFDVRRGANAEFRLSLSGRRGRIGRVAAHRWVLRAPAPDGVWEYFPARPRDRKALERVHVSGSHRLNAGETSFAYEYDEESGKLNVTVLHPRFPAIPPTPRETLATDIVVGLVGEDEFTRWIGGLEAGGTAAHPVSAAELLAAVEELAARPPRSTTWRDVARFEEGAAPVWSRVLTTPHWLDRPLYDQLNMLQLDCEMDLLSESPTPAAMARLDMATGDLDALLGERGLLVATKTSAGRHVIFLYTDSTDTGASESVAEWARRNNCVQISQSPNPGWSVALRQLPKREDISEIVPPT